MKKHLIMTTAVLGLMAAPALAQQPTQPSPPAPSASPTAPAPAPSTEGTKPMPSAEATKPSASSTTAAGGAGFMSEQKQNQWLASNLIGASVMGPDNKTIGEINDVVLDQTGTAEAAIVGVGGFLGVGEKDVAVPFKSLQVTRKDDGVLDKVTLSMTRADLEKAPTFMTLADKKSQTDRAARPAGTANPSTGSTKPAQ